LRNILLFSDLHLTQSDLPECIQILEEIGMLANQYNVDLLINLGDTFDNLKPSSLEFDAFATFIKRLNKKMIIIAAASHESETTEQNIVNHFGILSENVQVLKEYKDENHLYCGHFILKESQKKLYGGTISKEMLKQYRYVFLGHSHRYEIIKPNCCQLGSSRFVNFDEAQDQHKIVALIEDYKREKERVHFLALKSPISMIEIELIKE
jgi:DNA repair exonuclease SbcCD nuclease subunit